MAEDTQVLVRFVTKLPEQYHVPATQVAVPANLRRYGFSKIINHLLGLEPARPFDFIINGELLRKALDQHMLDHSLSSETVLEVEYVPAVLPPQPKDAYQQDDWVMCVAATGPSSSCLASGSADGSVQLWSYSDGAASPSVSFPAHADGVNSCCYVVQAGQTVLATAGKDHVVKLWQVQQASSAVSSRSSKAGSSSSTAQPLLLAVGAVHTDAVQAVAVSPDGQMLCSTGWDGQVALWDVGPDVLEAASSSAQAAATAAAPHSKKKRKTEAADGSAAAAATAAQQLEVVRQLHGHMHCVAAAAWPVKQTLFTGGWDHSVRRFDVETGTNTSTYNGSKAVYAVAAGDPDADGDPQLVAFGGADSFLRVWDLRSPPTEESLSVKAYPGHKGWVTGVTWRPGYSHQVATASHDGSVRVWDLRSSVPLGALEQHQDKALCVAWLGADALASGGADCKLQLYVMPEAATGPDVGEAA